VLEQLRSRDFPIAHGIGLGPTEPTAYNRSLVDSGYDATMPGTMYQGPCRVRRFNTALDPTTGALNIGPAVAAAPSAVHEEWEYVCWREGEKGPLAPSNLSSKVQWDGDVEFMHERHDVKEVRVV